MVILRLRRYKDSHKRIRGPGFYLFSKKKRRGKRRMIGGPYKTRKAALKRERQIQAFKHRK